MSGWDAEAVTFSVQGAPGAHAAPEITTRQAARNQFREFIRNFRDEHGIFPYRDQLLQRWRKAELYLEVDLNHLQGFNAELQDALQRHPAEYVQLFEEAVLDALRVLRDQSDDSELPRFQLILLSSQRATRIRDIKASDVNRLVRVPGIVISASRTRAKAISVSIRCSNCQHAMTMPIANAFGAVTLPRTCQAQPAPGAERCPVDPYVVEADRCTYVDQQTLKLQEAPEEVPTGEMPRHMLLSVDRHLVDRVPPGTRVHVLGVSSVFNSAGGKGGGQIGAVAIRTPYLRVLGLDVQQEGAGRANAVFTPEEEAKFRAMAASGDVVEKMVHSIAPSISGDYTTNIKKAIACLLVGGSRKVLPDGMRLRGDVNVLLLGDPSTAKSQFLKFVEKVAPVGVYTSGKGSSAAGLTASVIRDARGEFYLEGGAMVLADGGVVCIDEFDKMRETDRVAIHEAMEQQTISIAKAGITTILNSRCAVLAAANPVYGRYDDQRSAADNIDFLPSILSRFDLIFIVRDVRDVERDRKIADHVMNVHISAAEGRDYEGGGDDGEIDLVTMKRYIMWCRSNVAPRLSDEAKVALQEFYVKLRDESRSRQRGGDSNVIPITVRQLEALVRLSEALAKLRLRVNVTQGDVEEAIELFQSATGTAANYERYGPEIESVFTGFAADDVKKAELWLTHHMSVGQKYSVDKMRKFFTSMSGIGAGVLDLALHVMYRRGMVEKSHMGRVVSRKM